MAQVNNWLREVHLARQYLQDAHEMDSWIKERMPLVTTDDFGKDQTTAEVGIYGQAPW